MKKIYVMAAFLGATSFAFNQVQNESKQYTKNTEKALSTNSSEVKAPGVSLWADDFSTPTNWTIGTSGQGTFQIGMVADLPSPTYYSAITSTTVGNGFAFFAGVTYLIDPNIPVVPQNSWIEMATDFDATGHQGLTLKFQQAYRAFNSDKTYVEISTDGGATWGQRVDVNKGVPSNTSAKQKTIYQNFEANSSSTVKFRFRWENTESGNGASGYAWQIDDVEILTLNDNDVSTKDLYYGSDQVHYYKIPVAQIAPIESTVWAKNEGKNVQNGVSLKATESGSSYSSVSAPVTLSLNSRDSLVVANPFTPSGAGNYSLDFSIENDSIDDFTQNNVLNSYKFKVGGDVYARDSASGAESGAVYDELTTWGIQGGLIKKYAVAYDIYSGASLTGIDFQFGTKITPGEQIVGQLFDANLNLIAGAETEFYTMVAGDEKKYKTLAFPTPQVLAPGSYWVGVEVFGDSNSIATSGFAELGSVTQKVNATGWGSFMNGNPVYIIRMNFNSSVSLDYNELSNLNVSQNFPNPFANETTIVVNLKETSNVSYTVVDLTGKVVANVNKGTTMAGEHEITIDGSSYANGVYYLNITAGDANVTRKMIVNK